MILHLKHIIPELQFMNHLGEMPFLKEITILNKIVFFRISPVAFCIARILEQDFVLSGYHIKAGVS